MESVAHRGNPVQSGRGTGFRISHNLKLEILKLRILKLRYVGPALVLGVALMQGCGDTFRPTIIPVAQNGGNPSTLSNAVILSTNPADTPPFPQGATGSDMHIDVSGDNVVGVVPVGVNPVFMAKSIGGQVLVVNSNNTLSTYTALLPQGAIVNTITLPSAAVGPVSGAATTNASIYIANSGSNDVSVVASNSNSVFHTVPVGAQPVSVAAFFSTGLAAATPPSTNKVYVANRGGNSVSVISTTDDTVIQTVPVGAQPVWVTMSGDGLDVYVVNQGDGTVSVIDTATDTVIATIPVGPSPNFAFFESRLQRVYVSNTGNNSISIIKGDGITIDVEPNVLPVKLADVMLSGAPASVVALSDGTRAYAALGNCPAGINHTTLLSQIKACTGNQVSVIDVLAFRETKTIPVGSGPVALDASADATRVYVVNANDATVSTIKTSTESEVIDANGKIVRLGAPAQNLNCPTCPASPQTPFAVHVFP